MKNQLVCAVFSLSLLAVLAVGCGGSAATESHARTVEVVAQNVRFVPDLIEVEAGEKVILRLKNLDSTEHDLEVRGMRPTRMEGGGHDGHGSPIMLNGNLAVHAKAMGSATVEFQADEKGVYDVFCTIPGHEQAGMVARLVVN